MNNPTFLTPKQLETLSQYRVDPVLFIEDVFKVVPTPHQVDLLEAYANPGSKVSVRSGHGCFAPSTPVRMYDMSVKPVKHVKVGDTLMGHDFTPRNVCELCQGKEQMYEVEYDGGSKHTYNESHILHLVATPGDEVDVTLREFLSWSDRKQRNYAAIKMVSADPRTQRSNQMLGIKSIEKAPGDFYMGFELEQGPLFLHEDYTVLHNTGKSCGLSWILIHYLMFTPDSLVLCTAPSAHQLHDVLWQEMGRWHKKMPPWFRNQLEFTKTQLSHKANESDQPRFAIARTARAEKPEALAGLHATNMMVIVDEASGVPEQVYKTAEGTLSTKGARVIMCSNPTRTEGYFWNSQCHRDIAPTWVRLHFNAEDSPLADAKWINEMRVKYGRDSDVYRVRVLGEFPSASSDVLIPMVWVNQCYDRFIRNQGGLKIAGLDVARYGDDANGFVIRQGAVARRLETWRNKDLMWTVGHVYHSYCRKEFDFVCIDVIGLGSGVVDRLREMGVPVVEVNVSEAAPTKAQFRKLRDELWWRSRVFFNAKIGGVDHNAITRTEWEDLAAELSSPRFEYFNGKLKIESKDMMKKRGLFSPNLADAWNNTFARDVTGVKPEEVRYSVGGKFVQIPSKSGAYLG